MLDLIIGVVLTLGVVKGVRQGFSKAFFNLVGWIIALVISVQYNDALAPWMSFISQDLYIQKVCAFLLSCFSILGFTWWVAHRFNSLLTQLKLGMLDHVLGGVFGILKSLFVILIALQSIAPWAYKASFWKESKMVIVLMPYAPLVMSASKKIANEALQHFHQSEKRERISRTAESSAHVTENPFH